MNRKMVFAWTQVLTLAKIIMTEMEKEILPDLTQLYSLCDQQVAEMLRSTVNKQPQVLFHLKGNLYFCY